MLNTINYLVESELHSSRRRSGRSDLYQRRFDNANNLYVKDLKAHYSCVNAIEFSSGAQSDYMISGGDDKRVLVWNVCEHMLSDNDSSRRPRELKTRHNSNIFALSWDNENKRVFSGGNDHQLMVHDVQTY